MSLNLVWFVVMMVWIWCDGCLLRWLIILVRKVC